MTTARRLAAVALLLSAPITARGQSDTSTTAGRFDDGKMWVFEYPPAQYFSQTYGFNADSAWFARARLAALRIPGCSAAFVSPNGLVVTNHHCARGGVVAVTRPGESLLDSGFTARALPDERPVPNLWADQLIAITDVSDSVFAAVDKAPEAERGRARDDAVARARDRVRAVYASPKDSIVVQVASLYHGGRYSAYVFRRYTDVRLVAAAELQMGFFGGDPDNFTYPRYALDFAFLRVYGRDGKPLATPDHFRWSREGVKEGDAVFVIGNPGPTSRLLTVAQLELRRDVLVPPLIDWLSSRHAILGEYLAQGATPAERDGIQNRMFSLSNTLKASVGRLAALRDPGIMARRADAERRLRAAVAARPELEARYGGVFDRIAGLQRERRTLAAANGAFGQITSGNASSALLRRALLAADSATRAQAAAVPNQPAALERAFLTASLADLERWLGDTAARRLGGSAEELLAGSVFADSARTAQALTTGVPPDDPGARLARGLAPLVAQYRAADSRIAAAERELASELGRARFAVYGRDVPPDATGSPRITDGVVRGYAYNGTLAPWHTTFYGVYDRFAAHGRGSPWDLPARWVPAPRGLDLGTSLNFTSTADTYGGNSGSPAVLKDLSLVGLNFDRNMEGLSRDFIYLPERGRNIMVDVRAIAAALDHVYDLDRIVQELYTGRLFNTEREADRVR